MSEILAGEYILQHVTVSLVAVGAAGIVLRKVLGVFEKPRTPSAPTTCSHCSAEHAQRAHKVGRS